MMVQRSQTDNDTYSGAKTLKAQERTEEASLCALLKFGCSKCYSHGFYLTLSSLLQSVLVRTVTNLEP